ncbi:hypothetical protein ACQEVF_17800 [Nonomuraea polychroma]|uniref:hypothetical protein n=1 Tax=Nonomuraea polychroma TaxID=46176 RepID=UPI003D8A7765
MLDPADAAQRAAATAVLADPERRFVSHTPYDPLAIWSAFGIALGQRLIDTHLISKLIDPDERAGHGLKDGLSTFISIKAAKPGRESGAECCGHSPCPARGWGALAHVQREFRLVGRVLHV